MSNSKLGIIAAAVAVCLVSAAEATSRSLSASAGEREQHTHDHAHSHPHEHAATESARISDQPAANPWGWLGLYSILIAAASIFGGWLPGHWQLTHLRFQFVISIIGGLILGIGVLHLLPHALHELGQDEGDTVAKWMMVGMVAMFFLLRAFHVHHHEPALPVDSWPSGSVAEAAAETDAVHAHSHDSQCDHAHGHPGRLSWTGALLGLAVHTLMD